MPTSTTQDTWGLNFEDFTLFIPSYSNLKSVGIIDLIDSIAVQRDWQFKTKLEYRFEVVIYNYFITVFSIKLSDSDLIRLRKHPGARSKEFRMCGSRKHIPNQYFNKFFLSVVLLEKICKLSKKNLSIIIQIILRFLNITDEVNSGEFDNDYFHHHYTFETYEDSLKAFRTFLVWFDSELSLALQKVKGKDNEELVSLLQFVQDIIKKLPGTINLDEVNLPQNYIELILMYNPEFGELIRAKEAPEG